jgi:predicted nucleic acid-binding protein
MPTIPDDPLILFDATVMCGAFVSPYGVNYQLLNLADEGRIEGLTTDVAAYEFAYNALKGALTRGVVPDPQLVTDFFDSFPHLFDPETTPRVSIGRNVVEQVWMNKKPVGEVVWSLTGRTRDDLLQELATQQVVAIEDYDPTDLHLLVAAVEQKADIICSSNTRDLKQETYGSIINMTPRALFEHLMS